MTQEDILKEINVRLETLHSYREVLAEKQDTRIKETAAPLSLTDTFNMVRAVASEQTEWGECQTAIGTLSSLKRFIERES